MKMKRFLIVSLLAIGVLQLMGCSVDNSALEEKDSIIASQQLEIESLNSRISSLNEEALKANDLYELTKKALSEREETITRLETRIEELESMITFEEPDPNKKNYVGIGDAEFLPSHRQDKTSKGDSDFD